MRQGRKPVARHRTPDTRDMPVAPDALPRCPAHLSDVARKEWRRIATPLYRMGVLSVTDRAALAAYCQAWARWVEAEEPKPGFLRPGNWLGHKQQKSPSITEGLARLNVDFLRLGRVPPSISWLSFAAGVIAEATLLSSAADRASPFGTGQTMRRWRTACFASAVLGARVTADAAAFSSAANRSSPFGTGQTMRRWRAAFLSDGNAACCKRRHDNGQNQLIHTFPPSWTGY
jgi:hypothetical protein